MYFRPCFHKSLLFLLEHESELHKRPLTPENDNFLATCGKFDEFQEALFGLVEFYLYHVAL